MLKIAIAATFLAAALSAHGQPMPADAKGGSDHPLLSRYTGSWLIGWRTSNFAEVMPLQMLTEDIAKKKKLDMNLTVEGELTELFYSSPKGRTALEVQRNYEGALKKAGASLVYTCTGDTNWGCFTGGGPASMLLWNSVVPREQQVKVEGGAYTAFNATAQNLRMSLFKLTRAGADTYVTVYSVDVPKDTEDFGDSASTYVQIVQPKAMETGKVTVDANAMSKGLHAEGKIALYGLFFDTGKSEIKPESKAQLDEMVKLLQASAALKVFVVGHTDNQGALDANLALSRARAQAVVDALVKTYKIDAKRFAAAGVANYAPVASNASEAGRAKNRRVELVLQ
jgi:outer membrane protein OmpA-like peptidoglycan-associated protein